MATFDPPDAVAKFEEWRALNGDRFGPLDDWIVNFGRGLGGGDFAAVWILPEHLPQGFPISDKTLDR